MKVKLSRVFLVVALVFLVVLSACKLFATKKQPNVVFIMLDTLRADHLGVYGYERATSPNLDQFASENVLFKFAVTAAPWTPPSVAGMLSGLYPRSHSFMPPNSREEAKDGASMLSPNVLTLPEILKAQGYATHAISPNPWITKEFGYDQGFDQFEYHPRAQAEAITKLGIKAIDQLAAKDQPFFVYLHYLDPHDPYTPPSSYAKKFQGPLKSREYSPEMQRKIGLYDGEIAYMDQWLGGLFDHLKEKGLYEDCVIVVIGDHGEQFLEHGNLTHGNQVVNPELHVPLMIRTGATAQKRIVDYTVSTIDVFPTVLELVGLKAPDGYQSVSLVKDEYSSTRGGVLSEIRRKFNQRSFTSYDGKRLVIGSSNESLDVSSEDPTKNIVALLDSVKDYWEVAPLNNPDLLKELQLEFSSELERSNRLKVKPVVGADVSEEQIKQLESLGYLK